jgi:CHASE3 domain sensor protein
MEPQTNLNEQQLNEKLLIQLHESNNRLRSMQYTMIGILITTGIVAVFFIILYSKLNGLGREGF